MSKVEDAGATLDPVQVAREAVAAENPPKYRSDILAGNEDRDPVVLHAILGARAMAEAMARPVAVPVSVLPALAAAISLLERSPRPAEPSDQMFDRMLAGFRTALEEGRSALSATPPAPSCKIITEHVYPPIPYRGCDWRATYEGWDLGDPTGEGATEAEAIADLINNYAPPSHYEATAEEPHP